MTRSTLRFGVLVVLAFFNAAGTADAQLIINAMFDTSITSDPNASTIEAGINAVIAKIEGDIASPITVNITYQKVSTGLGASLTYSDTVPYTTYLGALKTSQRLSANDNTAIASLPTGPNNPVTGDPNVKVNTPLLRALGIENISGPGGSDGTISLNTSIMNLSRTGPQNSSFYDLQSVAAHETDEVLGIGGPGSALQLSGSYTNQTPPTGPVGVLDLFRYSAKNVRSFSLNPGTAAYFSIDSGATNLANFNQNGNNSDFADWGNGNFVAGNATGNNPPQVQDAYGTPGTIVDIGANELTALDVVGYNLTPVPEPSTFALVGAAALALRLPLRRRRVPDATPSRQRVL